MLPMRGWIALSLIMGALVAALLPVPGTRPAQAAGVVGDGTPGSCTEAALDAALLGGGAVTFNCGPAPYTILFTSQKSISVDTTIDGGGVITLDGQDTTRLFDVGALLTLQNIVLTRGYFNGDGGAISNTGTLVLENSTIRESIASASGGAILSTGPLTIINSLLMNNQALNGGALYTRWAGAQTTIVDSVLANNQATGTSGLGGAILAWDGARVTIERSDIYSNFAYSGGGIYNTANSVLTLGSDTLVRENTASGGGGLYNRGTAMLTNVTLSGNSADLGGGLNNDGTALLTMTNVTLSGNSADVGGGLFNFLLATLTMTNVTLSGNSAGVSGGGLESHGTATLTNVTLSSNSAGISGGGLLNHRGTATLTNVTFSGNSAVISGGGIFVNAGTVSVKNSIMANSPSGGNCTAGVTNAGFNLSSDPSCGFNQVPDIMLGPLGDNGGATQTHALAAGSPAIDFVATGCPPPTTDQRGMPRPVDGDGDGVARCDAGPVEYGPALAMVYLPLVRR